MDASQARIAVLEAENARLRADNARLQADNADLHADNTRLQGEVKKLKTLVEELHRGSKRQAAPFSKGPPKSDPKPPGRKPGAAYGARAFRKPPDAVDEVHEASLPERCPYCGGAVVFDSTDAQFQLEIPRTPSRRRFNVHVGHCACCGRRVQGRHPLQTSNALGAAASQVGPDAQALAATLNKEAGLSHGKIQRVLQTLFGITISRGASAQIVLRAADRCAPAYQGVQAAVKRAPWCVPDETGWKVGGRLQWLHAFVTAKATLYLIRPSRGFDVAAEALGPKYAGGLTHDGWKPYDHFLRAAHQQCTSHLLRRCEHLLETATRGAVRFPRQVKELLQTGLDVRDLSGEGGLSPAQTCVVADRLTRQLRQACAPKTDPGNARLAKFLRAHAQEVFNYLRHPLLPATNWPAEQAIRPAVVNRKVWGGSRTQRGAHAQGVLLSVLRTATQLGRATLDFLSATLRAPPQQAPPLVCPY